MYVKHCTSPPQLELALFDSFFFGHVTRESVQPHCTVMASTFLLGVTILWFRAFPLAFLARPAFLSFPTPFVGLVPTVLRKVSFLRAHLTDSILREYALRSMWRWTLTRSFSPWPLFVVQLPSERTCRALVEFRSRCSRKEASGKWWSTTPNLIASEILSPLLLFVVLHLLFPGRQQLCHV